MHGQGGVDGGDRSTHVIQSSATLPDRRLTPDTAGVSLPINGTDSIARSPRRPWRQARGSAAVDVVEDLADEFRIGDICDDAKLPAAERAEGDVDFEDSF